MSAQYRNKVLNRVRSRKDDYYFFYYLFLRVIAPSRSDFRFGRKRERDGEWFVAVWLRGRCSAPFAVSI